MIQLITHSYDYEPEFLGDGLFSFSSRDLVRHISPTQTYGSHFVQGNYITSSIWSDLDDYKDGKEYRVSDADLSIIVLYLFAKTNANISVHFEGPSEYWAYHDLVHAQRSVEIYMGSPKINIDADEEEIVTVESAKLSLQNGLTLADIVRQLIEQEPDFKQRFGRPTTAIEDFLSCLSMTCDRRQPKETRLP